MLQAGVPQKAIPQTVATPAPVTAPAAKATTSTYKAPSGVTDVYALQKQLNASGANLVVDGKYGPKTAAAYAQYGTKAPTATASVAAPTAIKPISVTPAQANPMVTGNVYDLMGYKPQTYSSPYRDEAIALIKDAQDDVYDPKTYNPEADARFTTFRDKAIETGQRGYSANLGTMNRNGLASSSVAQQIAQGAMDKQAVNVQRAVPEFQKADEAQFRQATDDKYARAEKLLGLDSTSYNRFIDTENRNISSQDRYKTDTGYAPVDTSLIPADSWIRQISDYAAYKKTLPAGSPMLAIVDALRDEKIAKDPTLLAKYGTTMSNAPGVKTAATVAAERNDAQEDAKIAISGTNASRTSGSGSGTTRMTSDPNTMGTPAQVTAYYDYLNIFGGGGNGTYAGNPAAASQRLTTERGTIERTLGTPLYEKLFADIKALDTITGAPAKPEAATDPLKSPSAIRAVGMFEAMTPITDYKGNVTGYKRTNTDQAVIDYVLANVTDPDEQIAVLNHIGVPPPPPPQAPTYPKPR